MRTDFRRLGAGNHRLACPECNKSQRDTALSVTVRDDRSAVWVCFRCGWKGATRGDRPPLTTISGGRNRNALPTGGKNVKAAGADPNHKRDQARAIWQSTVPLADTLGAKYLALRRCALPPADGDLRFHAALYCGDVGTELPALVARVSTVIGNRGVGIHRVWIRPDEPKAVAKRRLGGAVNDAVCIRLWPDAAIETTLGIAEGIETALAAAHRFQPMWATIDAGQMAKFPVIEGLDALTIFADYDPPGMRAAAAAQMRYFAANRPAQLVRSRIVGQDFNDVWMAHA